MDRPRHPPYQKISLGNAGTVYIRPAVPCTVHDLEGRALAMEIRKTINVRPGDHGIAVCVGCIRRARTFLKGPLAV